VAAVTRRPPRRPAPDPAGGEPLPPAWGWKRAHGGRAAWVDPGAEYQATTVQACGLYPFTVGAGSPMAGTPVGRHQLDGDVVCLGLLEWLREGLITNPGMFVLGQPGSGKALDLLTPLPTPEGWTTMGAVAPGDRLLDQDGRPVLVLAATPSMAGRPCLRVTFDDGTSVVADAAHQWLTATPAASTVPGAAAIRTTAQIAATVGWGHQVPAAPPLDLPAADLAVEPYLLGTWLAGGGAAPVPAGARPGRAAGGARGAGDVLRAQLGVLGLLGAPAVPAAYLRASVGQRRALLAGILDTAATVPRPGTARYAAPSARLARDTAELARSLGHRAAVARDAPGWAVTVEAAGPLFRQPAKHAALAAPEHQAPAWRTVTAVTPVPSRPVRCVQVASRAGLFLAGPGMTATHNSTLVKRLAVGAAARGDTVLVLGDPRPDYVPLTEALGGQVIRVGRGLDRLNPLDAGPLGTILRHLPAADAARVRAEVRARRLSLLAALCALVRGRPLGNHEEVILGAAVDLLADRSPRPPVIPDVLRVIDEGPEALRAAARADDREKYRALAAPLAYTLDLLLTGTLAGAFDAPTSTPLDLDAPMVTVDISRAGAAGDKLLTAAMLCTWAYGFAVADAAGLLAEHGVPARHSYLAIMDELWRAIRGAPGLVEAADTITRLNRAMGWASVMITHSLADLDALASEEDRAKARGFVERSAVTVLAALPPRELDKVTQITPLTGPEKSLVARWAAPESWQPGSRHPGRGRYLVKTGGRLGLPLELSLVPAEIGLYDTDQAVRRAPGHPRPGSPEEEGVPVTGTDDSPAAPAPADGAEPPAVRYASRITAEPPTQPLPALTDAPPPPPPPGPAPAREPAP
jgi:hypothetical protein